MYKKIFAQRIGNNRHLIHLWTDQNYEKVEWTNYAYKECPEGEGNFIGLNGESLRKTSRWNIDDSKLHFHDKQAKFYLLNHEA